MPIPAPPHLLSYDRLNRRFTGTRSDGTPIAVELDAMIVAFNASLHRLPARDQSDAYTVQALECYHLEPDLWHPGTTPGCTDLNPCAQSPEPLAAAAS